MDIAYPVLEYPAKVRSFNLDKNPQAEGVLQGIKGQYLIFDTGGHQRAQVQLVITSRFEVD